MGHCHAKVVKRLSLSYIQIAKQEKPDCTLKKATACGPRRLVITPYNCLKGKASPERGTFIFSRKGYVYFQINERLGKSFISVCKKAQMANRCIFWL